MCTMGCKVQSARAEKKAIAMNDTDLANAVKQCMQTNPYITRKKLRDALCVGSVRLERLEANGLVKLPLKLSKKLGAPMGKIAGGWGDRFSIKKRK